jgi:hypothetical protein
MNKNFDDNLHSNMVLSSIYRNKPIEILFVLPPAEVYSLQTKRNLEAGILSGLDLPDFDTLSQQQRKEKKRELISVEMAKPPTGYGCSS